MFQLEKNRNIPKKCNNVEIMKCRMEIACPAGKEKGK
jgi:hypothetical protein